MLHSQIHGRCVFLEPQFDSNLGVDPEGSRVTQQVLDADTPLSELAENNELELTLVVRLSLNKSHDGRNPHNGGSGVTTMGRKLPRYEILKIASVFGDVTRLQWGSTLKLVSVLRLTIISWNSHRQVRNPGIQEWTNEWITAYLHLVGEGKLTIMSYVMIPHDFTSVNASRGEVSGVLCSKCFHMISHVHHVHILNARLFASWSFLVWTPRKCVTGGDCISWLHCKGLELAGWRMCTNLIRPFSRQCSIRSWTIAVARESVVIGSLGNILQHFWMILRIHACLRSHSKVISSTGMFCGTTWHLFRSKSILYSIIAC